MPDNTSETKSYQKFRSRIQYLEMHTQTIDAALNVMRHNIASSDDKKTSLAEILGFEANRYSQLNHPTREKDRIINHSRARNSEYAVITLYSYFTEYLQNILGEIYAHKPLDVVGKSPNELKFSYAEIVKLGSFEAISEKMIANVFRNLENQKSTIELLDKILTRTVTIDENIKTKGLKYLDMRHLFVHGSGIVDQDFVRKYGEDTSLKVGDDLPTTYGNAKAAIEAVTLLCSTIDQSLISNGFVKSRILEPGEAG